LALALYGSTVKQAAALTLVCAFVFWVCSISWLLLPLLEASKSTLFLVLLIYGVVCLWQTVPYVVMGCCYAQFRWDKNRAGPVLVAAVLTVAWSYWPTLIPGLPQHSLY